MTRRTTNSARAATVVLLLAVVLSTTGCKDILGVQLGGEPGGGGQPTPGEVQGVQAFGTIVQGVDGTVHARLDVLTLSGEARYLSGVVEPALTVGTERVPLVTGATVGVFETSSQRSDALVYVPGGVYRFSFTIIDEEGGEHIFRAYASAPDETPIVDVPVFPFRGVGEPVDVSLSSMADAGVLRVYGPQGVTYDTSGITSIADIASVRPAMERSVGPDATLPGAAFPTPGLYTIEVTSMHVRDAAPTESDEDVLGALSWFGAGTTVETTVTIE